MCDIYESSGPLGSKYDKESIKAYLTVFVNMGEHCGCDDCRDKGSCVIQRQARAELQVYLRAMAPCHWNRRRALREFGVLSPRDEPWSTKEQNTRYQRGLENKRRTSSVVTVKRCGHEALDMLDSHKARLTPRNHVVLLPA